MSEILNTPFTHKHIALGAKMAPFAGYNMPISYTGINDEHAAVRNSAGVFDVSHMGEFVLKGENALDLIQRVTSNDASVLEDGKAQYSCLPNTNGGIVDDLLVYCVEKNKVYMLVVNASNIEKDWNWISSYNTKGVEMHNISAKTALLAVQGPNATKIVQSMTKMDVLNLPYYSFVKGDLLGIDNVLISATGYTGSGGVEIYFEDLNDNANKVWDALFEAGAAFGLKPIGLGARDTLRLEAGLCLYGHDMDINKSPVEANLKWAISKNRIREGGFIGFEKIKSQIEKGVSKVRVGIKPEGRIIAREKTSIFSEDNKNIGEITSGTFGPSVQAPVAMGYVENSFSKIDTKVFLEVRGKKYPANISNLPFYKKSYVKGASK